MAVKPRRVHPLPHSFWSDWNITAQRTLPVYARQPAWDQHCKHAIMNPAVQSVYKRATPWNTACGGFVVFWVEHLKGYIRFVEGMLAYCLLGSSSAHGMQSMAKASVYMCVHSPTNNTLNKLTIFFNVFSKFLTATVIYWSSFVELTVQILMFILIWKCNKKI